MDGSWWMLRYMWVVLLAGLVVGCGPKAGSSPEPVEETRAPASATMPPVTQVPSPTPRPSATLTPTPTGTPTPTPVPKTLTWTNPFSGEEEVLPRTCVSVPEFQALIEWAQEDPEGLARAWIDYWEGYFQDHPGLLEEKVYAEDWYRWPFELPHIIGGLVQIDALPFPNVPNLPAQGSHIFLRFPMLVFGLANVYTYPDLGVTVFTACALIYDNDLAQRVSTVEEMAQMPSLETNAMGEVKALVRPDPENAQPRWYFSEVAVAYVVHPESWLNEVPSVQGEVIMSIFQAGGSVGAPQWISYEAQVVPGCYYILWPQILRERAGEDPKCAYLDTLAQALGQYIGMVLLEDRADELIHQLTIQAVPLVLNLQNFGLAMDYTVQSRESLTRDQWLQSIGEILEQEAGNALDPLDPNARYAQTRGVAQTLSWVVLAWKDAPENPSSTSCPAYRALFHYKMDPDLLPEYCSMEEASRSDYWISFDPHPLLFDGEPFLLTVQDLLALRQP